MDAVRIGRSNEMVVEMKALKISRKTAKFAVARLMSPVSTIGAAKFGPLSLVNESAPTMPNAEGWHRIQPRLTGICGSDLSLVEGHASTYFDDWVSFPFVPGHEVVADCDDGRRVVLEPVLGHACRGLPLPFEGAAPGDGDDYAHLVGGHLEPGIQTGFCTSTGGGWATELIAHDSQLHEVPDSMSDEQAVLVEPAAGGIHAALATWPAVQAAIQRGETPIVAVLAPSLVCVDTFHKSASSLVLAIRINKHSLDHSVPMLLFRPPNLRVRYDANRVDILLAITCRAVAMQPSTQLAHQTASWIA
ncbi:MAG: hypothetical protein RIS69_1654 [Actinomycetota bacterium]